MSVRHTIARVVLCAGAVALSACSVDVEVHDVITHTDHVHTMPYSAAGAHPFVAPSGAHLTYYGGKVVQAPDVVQVLYGAGTYIPQLTATSGVTMATFYSQAVTSGVFDWLSEYDTTSPAQTIGRGSFGGAVQITPAASRDGSTIADADIQAELAAQINSGALPAPSDNTIYMVHFPAGKTNTDPSGAQSCVSGGFCAYHGTFTIGSQNVYYGVLPDMTGGCASGCGGSTTFANQTSVASHEMIETVTDAEVGLSTSLGPPLGWYDNNNGEIGDICNAQQGTFTGTDGNTYTIQQEFSNQANDCITTRATSTSPDFTVAVSPGSASVTAGGTTTFAISTTAVAGSTQAIALSVSGLPTGVTGSISPSSVTAGDSATLTVDASASATGAATFTVTGTSGSTTHEATASLSVTSDGGGGGSGSGGGSGGPTMLTNGVPLPNQAGATGAQAQYEIDVPAGQATLTVTIQGGTGDADLYVRAGAAPTLTSYDCRPYITGNSETCTLTTPAAGPWYIMLNGYAAYSGVTLAATYAADTTPALASGVPVNDIAGAVSSDQYWKMTVPSGQSQLTIQISGGTGDADLYVKQGTNPTTSSFDCRPYLTGTNETCTFSSPAAGDYYVMLHGYAAFSGVSLVGTLQ